MFFQAQLDVGKSDDPLEHEADRVAERVMSTPDSAPSSRPALSPSGAASIQRACAACGVEEEATLRRKPSDSGPRSTSMLPPIDGGGFAERLQQARTRGGEPLSGGLRAFMEPRFQSDFAAVRVHHDARATALAKALGARAFTVERDIFFQEGEYRPGTRAGRRLVAHELTHTLQQGGAHAARAPTIQRQTTGTQAGASQVAASTPTAKGSDFSGPLNEREWHLVELWLSLGEAGVDRLTADPENNADVVASAIFCSRALSSLVLSKTEDPLLCLTTEVTAADPRVRALRPHVLERGPIINWPAVPIASRLAYAMQSLIDTYHYPVNGAAGIVGNLFAESGVLPSRIEGSADATPLRSANFAGAATDFSADQVMNRNSATRTGPRMPGIGIAQWTSGARRSGLFQRTDNGRALGASILFNMDAQIAYLVEELQAHAGLNASLTAANVSVDGASDDVVYQFEIPGALLDGAGNRVPRTDAAAQAVFRARRPLAQRALREYQAAQAGP